MAEPAYVSIAGVYARRIRSGELPPATQLPSHTEIAKQHGVSDIVVRKALELLQGQGLVRSVQRRGVFVADRPYLVRMSPERQPQNLEVTFNNESDIQIEREIKRACATDELARAFGLLPGDEISHVITKTSEDRRPISISDTYQPLNITGISAARVLEETIADQLPTPTHADWLRTPPGELVKTVRQRFITADDHTVMISDVSYPRDRYAAFVFRVTLPLDS